MEVGAAVTVKLGPVLGSCIGVVEGERLGSTLGSDDGTAVGVDEGAAVTVKLGSTPGACVGIAVGADVGVEVLGKVEPHWCVLPWRQEEDPLAWHPGPCCAKVYLNRTSSEAAQVFEELLAVACMVYDAPSGRQIPVMEV